MTIIVAEIAQNHLGIMGLARNLITSAKKNGADLCKLQLYDHQKLYADEPNIPDSSLSFNQAQELFLYGASIGMEVFFSVFDTERVEWCERIGVKRYKVAFTSRFDNELINAIGKTKKKWFVSANVWRDFAKAPYYPDMLFCVPKYPALPDDIRFPNFIVEAGFSDHTVGVDCAKIAIAKGARVLEKHFALDHKTGVDAGWSMDAKELKELRRFADLCTLTSRPRLII